MQITYDYTFEADRQTVWNYLQDEDVLGRTLPGCQSFETVGDGRYHAELGLNVGPVKGAFTGEVKLTEQHEPESYTLGLEGQGKPGEINADAHVTLQEDNGQTVLSCRADAQTTGVLASVGQRVMGGVAKMMLGQFFKAVDADIQKAE